MMRTFVLLMISIGLVSPAVAQPDPFAWIVGSQAIHGCWAETGQTDTPCKRWWDMEDPNLIQNFHACAGTCEFQPAYGHMGCKLLPSNRYERRGPDLMALDKMIGAVPFAGHPGPGNVPRMRDLKCIERGECACQIGQGGASVFCIPHPTKPKTFENPISYITDAGGPICIVPGP